MCSDSSGLPSNWRSIEINLNDNWRQSSNIANPDSSNYIGVYESYSNYNTNSTTAIMSITINKFTEFNLYIRSYAESSYDYVMASVLDGTIDNSTTYSNANVKAHTRGNQQSGTKLNNYTLVSYTGIDGGKHTITIAYKKDSSTHSNDDRGYLLIPKN